MIYDIQAPRLSKRISAWLLDVILIIVVVTGMAALLTSVLGYDAKLDALDAVQEEYETQYGVDFDANMAELTDAQQEAYLAAAEALQNDQEAMKVYSTLINLTILVISLSVFVAHLVLEFAVPLILKNGQTLGKKCFSLGVVRVDGVKINPLQLFARTVLGKYAVETMIPGYILLMLFWGAMDMTGTLVLLALLITQVVCVALGQTRATIHDRLAGTVVVDIASQKIFESTEDLIAYTKRIHAEQARKQDY